MSMIRKVLFVDDDQMMLLALQKRLTKYGDIFSMILAEDGFDAVRKLKGNPVSLVVLDLKMPRMDGVSLLTHISDKYPDIPVIIISGYRTAEMQSLAREKEVVAYISKPFQVDDLAKVILSTLSKETEGGTLHNVSPVVFLQLMEMESRTCTIRIVDKDSERGGVLFFKEGNLYDARVDQVKGINAAYIIFTWENVTLFIRNECPVKINVVNSSLQPIIMKAVGMKDEKVTEIEEEVSESELELENQEEITQEEQAVLTESNTSDEDEIPREDVSSLEDLELPEEVVVTKPLNESMVDRVRNILLREIGEKCGLQDVYQDPDVDRAVESISKLGDMFNFGNFKVGYIDRNKGADEVIVQGESLVIVKVDPKCPQDKIVQVLNTHF